MKTYGPYILAVLYLAVFFLPFASSMDALSYSQVTVTGFDFVASHLQGFGLLLTLLVGYVLAKPSHETLATVLLTLVGVILLYLYGSPFYVSNLGSTSYGTYLNSLLRAGLQFGYYISALLAVLGYALLWKER
jgi:hypothetical protein